MALKIGQKVGNKIYAGPDYGLQSPATFNKLKKSGALKLGASAVRRGSQLLRKLGDRLPKQVKDAGRWFAETEQRENQRLLDRGFTQESIDRANAEKQRLTNTGEADAKAIRFLSDRTNVAPEIVGGAVTLAQTLAEGKLSAGATKRTLKGLAKQADAPVAYAMGDDIPELPRGKFPGGSAEALKRDTAVRSGIQQKVRDIRSGKAKPAQSSVNKASDKSAIAKAEAASKASTRSNRTSDDVILPTKGDRTTDYNRLNPKTGEIESATQKPIRSQASYAAEPIKGKAANSKRIQQRVKQLREQQKARFNRAKDKVQQARDLERSKVEQERVDRFFSGGDEIDFGGGPLSSLPARRRTAPTFPSKKGADVRTPRSGQKPETFDDYEDYIGNYDDLYSSGSGDGLRVIDGEVKGGKAGQPGPRASLSNAVQQQRFSELIGVDLSKMSRAARREAIIEHISKEKNIRLRTMPQSKQNELIKEFIADNKLTDNAVSSRIQKRLSERRFPEQFNQIEAKERQGVELPSRNRNTADRRGRKTRPHGSRRNPGTTSQSGQEVVNPDRDYVLGKGSKPREANKIPNADNLSVQERIKQRTQTNEAGRSDNIPGGRRLPQSRATYKQRIKEARDRARARNMVTFQGKRRFNEIVKSKGAIKLPETKPGVAEQQFKSPVKGKLTAKQKKLIAQEEKNRSVRRTLENQEASLQRLRSGGDRQPESLTGNRGRNRVDQSTETTDAIKASRKSDATGTYSDSAKAAEVRIGNVAQPAGPKRPQSSIARRATQKARSSYEKRLAALKKTDPEAYEAELKKFLKENLKQDRFTSPQDGKKNPNPFTSSGELRGVDVKGDSAPKGRSKDARKSAAKSLESIREKLRKRRQQR